MDELPFKIVKMLGARDEVIARVENLLICKAAAAWTLSSLDRWRERSERERKRRIKIASGSRCNSATGLQTFFGAQTI
jgi:hypothetical protein